MGMIGAQAEIQQIIDGMEQVEHGNSGRKELQRLMSGGRRTTDRRNGLAF